LRRITVVLLLLVVLYTLQMFLATSSVVYVYASLLVSLPLLSVLLLELVRARENSEESS
jgi:succinate-acetate transporter protein